MLKTPLQSILLVVAASVLGAVGQYLFQYGATHGKPGLGRFFTNPYILLGMGGYLAVMALFTQAFKLGGTVRVLYPIYATTFIWAAVIAALRYSDAIQPLHVAGMVLLLGGIVCMSW